MKNMKISVRKETEAAKTAGSDPAGSKITIDPFDNSLLGNGIPNYVLDPKSLGETDFPPLASSDEIEAMNQAYQEVEKMQPAVSNLQSAWIQTYTGKKFFPLNPRLEDICLEDIAHALAMQCRFTGHCKHHYSIGQHSVLVSYLCDSADSLHGLLHDASEAYITDLASPLKRSGHFEEYKKVEKRLQDMIFRKFELSEIEPPSVKKADLLMLAIEAETLLSPLHPEWKLSVQAPPLQIVPMAPNNVKVLFLERFQELTSF